LVTHGVLETCGGGGGGGAAAAGSVDL